MHLWLLNYVNMVQKREKDNQKKFYLKILFAKRVYIDYKDAKGSCFSQLGAFFWDRKHDSQGRVLVEADGSVRVGVCLLSIFEINYS